MTKKEHAYAAQAAELLQTCLGRVRVTRQHSADERANRCALGDIENALIQTERLLHTYFIQLIDLEREKLMQYDAESSKSIVQEQIPTTLTGSMVVLQSVLDTRRLKQKEAKRTNTQRISSRHTGLGEVAFPSKLNTSGRRAVLSSFPSESIPDDKENISSTNYTEGTTGLQYSAKQSVIVFSPRRSVSDTLLFRLITILELCVVRLGDIHLVLTGRHQIDDKATINTYRSFSFVMTATACVGVGSMWLSRRERPPKVDLESVLGTSGKAVLLLAAGALASRKWSNIWMKAKLVKSKEAIEKWQQEWLIVQSSGASAGSLLPDAMYGVAYSTEEDSRSQRLIEHALNESPKSSFWHSEGEIRFLFLRRAMDLLYASIGTAVEVTKATEKSASESLSIWKIPLAAAAAASYYSVAGPHLRASQAVDTRASDVMKYAWGMVSLPSVKRLSLKASQILKGAALAERIYIAGIPCFVLSRDIFPDLAAAVRRTQRKAQRQSMKRLSTIFEQDGNLSISVPSSASTGSLQRKSSNLSTKDVIFHLTGGGFFAHTIASDLPYLLDWSKTTGAVVICPEYALLPDHPFPAALEQISAVYRCIMSGDVSSELGFEVNRVVVTGESAGGNLAAALCVKLVSDKNNNEEEDGIDVAKLERARNTSIVFAPLPDALMLSCPALNLSLELSPSRVRGHEDPVLPSGLISAISNAYVPANLGTDKKKNPLASPFYAPDDVLTQFPTTLLFVSSEDPLLDDAVVFNKRLRRLGVDSNLRAAHNMPHAYWGLGTAGFPEAMQVQQECEEFLVQQLETNQAALQ